MSASILLVDKELGFLWALTEELKKHGIGVIPSHSIREAEALLLEIQPELGLVLLDCRCTGACSFVGNLLRRDARLRVIGVMAGRYQCARCVRFLAVRLQRPDERFPKQIESCAKVLRALLEGRRAWT